MRFLGPAVRGKPCRVRLLFYIVEIEEEQLMKKVAVIMGSASDLPVVRKAAETLRSFGVPFEVHVYSAHRTPAQV